MREKPVREVRAMAEKSTFVDMIQEATRQNRRRFDARAPKPSVGERPRLGRWPPPRLAAWRLEMLKPWKAKD